MRKLALIFILSLLSLSCKNSGKSDSHKENEGLDQAYSDYKELALLKDYYKISDTSYVKNGIEPTHRITQLQKNNETLILFNKISFDKEYQEVYRIIDTLKINDLKSNTFVTIGYCENNNLLPEEIIAIVEKTNNDTIQKIIKAWRANSNSQKIEKIEDLNNLICLNDY